MKSKKALARQVALVTGAAKRIGRSIALRLAKEGADVVINYATSNAEAEELASEIQSLGRHAIALQADVSRRADVHRMIAAIDKEFGRLDILVNNAGMFFEAKFEELTDGQWDRIVVVLPPDTPEWAAVRDRLTRAAAGGR